MIRLKDLAQELGVSPATVSLALQDSPLVAESTKKRVKELARKKDYVCSNLGRALQKKQSQLIGYLIDDITKSFYNEVLQGAIEAAGKYGYGLLTGLVTKDMRNIHKQVDILLEKDVDAVVISEHCGLVARHLERFRKRNKAVIYSTCKAPAEFCSDVVNDDFEGGRLAVEHLAQNGHSNILISNSSPERLSGNLAAAHAGNVKTSDYFTVEEAMEKILKDRSISAVACYSDVEACKLFSLIKQNGLRIPEDISLTGFDNLPICNMPEYNLTTIAQQRIELGRKAVETAIKFASGKLKEPEHIILKPKLIMRGTVLCKLKNQPA